MGIGEYSMFKAVTQKISNFFRGDSIELLIKNTILLGLVAILVLISSLIIGAQLSDNIFLKIYVILEFAYIIIFIFIFEKYGI